MIAAVESIRPNSITKTTSLSIGIINISICATVCRFVPSNECNYSSANLALEHRANNKYEYSLTDGAKPVCACALPSFHLNAHATKRRQMSQRTLRDRYPIVSIAVQFDSIENIDFRNTPEIDRPIWRGRHARRGPSVAPTLLVRL